MKAESGIFMDQKRKSNLLEDEITAIVERNKVRQHVLFSVKSSRDFTRDKIIFMLIKVS